MFKKTKGESQLGIFSNPNSFLSGKSETNYEKQDAWHNVFRLQVTIRIDESICKPLFTEQTGAPNSSVRVLIAMMILKEGKGWSDAELFEQGRYNLLVRSALGLMNMDDAIPTESTYYLFRKRIVEYEKTKEINLFEKTFASVTTGQAIDFEVSGKSIRMDSKLLGSNIAWLSRYELIHETLRLFCQDVRKIIVTYPLLESEKNVVENLLKETGNKVVYRSTNDEVKTKIQELGTLAYKLIHLFNSASSNHYTTLNRVFAEQFIVEAGKTIISRNKEEISSHSVQSPHDTDCHYRNKDGNQVKGYSINVTESCDSEQLNLITGVDVRVVSASDNDFLQNGVEQAQEIVTGTIENIHTDGAYHSTGNQAFCTKGNIELLLNAIQGPDGRFDLLLNENNELKVVDTQTNEIIPATKLKDQDKWSIKTNGRHRYFTKTEIAACSLRRKIAAIPQEILNIRNNVEATIFQLGFHYPHNKSRYRGLIKHKMWANIRSLWVNFVRIVNHVNLQHKTNTFWSNFRSKKTLMVNITISIISITNFKKLSFKTIRLSSKINFLNF